MPKFKPGGVICTRLVDYPCFLRLLARKVHDFRQWCFHKVLGETGPVLAGPARNGVLRMKSFIFVLFVLFTFSFFSGPLSADSPHNGDTACDVLQGGTPGLFGLCNAFHRQNCDEEDPDDLPRSCDRILNNYRDTAQPGDPDMPGLEPPVECPCWSEGDLSVVGALIDSGMTSPSSCLSSLVFGATDSALYSGLVSPQFTHISFFIGGPGICQSLGGSGSVFSFTTAEEAAACTSQLHGVHLVDFADPSFNCVP
jgi:hypothetical protein